MKRKVLVVGSMFAVATLVGAWWMTRDIDPVFDSELNVVYRLQVSNPSANAVRDARLLAYAPIPETATQRLLDLQVGAPHSDAMDRSGNRILEIRLDLLPPYGKREIAVQATLASAAEANAGQGPGRNEWTGEAPGLALDHPALAQLIVTLDPLRSAEQPARIQSLVAERLKVSDYDAVPRGARWALDSGQGDCSEFAAVAASLARAVGRPARLVDGWKVDGGGVLEAAAFHTWVEVWDGRRWQIVDAHAQATGGYSGRYVAFRYQPDDPNELASGFSRFRAEGPVTVEML